MHTEHRRCSAELCQKNAGQCRFRNYFVSGPLKLALCHIVHHWHVCHAPLAHLVRTLAIHVIHQLCRDQRLSQSSTSAGRTDCRCPTLMCCRYPWVQNQHRELETAVVVESQAGRAVNTSQKSSDPSASSDVSGPSDDEGGKDPQCVFQAGVCRCSCSCNYAVTLRVQKLHVLRGLTPKP